jgi:hypothetical protein
MFPAKDSGITVSIPPPAAPCSTPHENHLESLRHEPDRCRLAPSEPRAPDPLAGPGEPRAARPRAAAGIDVSQAASLSVPTRLAGERCVGRCSPPLQASPIAPVVLPSLAEDRKPLSRILTPRVLDKGRASPRECAAEKSRNVLSPPRRNAPASCCPSGRPWSEPPGLFSWPSRRRPGRGYPFDR